MKKHVMFGVVMGLGLLAASGAQAAGDAAKGKDVFKACQACHSTTPDKNGVGPSLAGVVGRAAAGLASFTKYSAPMKELAGKGHTWTEDNLKAYIANPKAVVPGGSMAYAGLKDADKLEDLIAFLKAPQ